jgi:cytochrome c biogenesis protein CcmG/thiol:disulfide interchange protein DsbE
MRPITRRIFYLAVFLLGFGWAVFSRPAAGSTTAGSIPAPQVGFRAPAFTLKDLAGKTVNLTDYQGQVVLLNFWASWCPPCRAEMPAFEQIYQGYQHQGLIVLAVNASNQDAPEKILAFLGSFPHSFEILLDDNGGVNQLYTIASLPTTFFIGRDGTIRDVVIGGPLTVAGLSARVETLLQEAP